MCLNKKLKEDCFDLFCIVLHYKVELNFLILFFRVIFRVVIMEIVSVYQKKRKEFGRQPLFTDTLESVHILIQSDPSYAVNYAVKNPISSSAQCVPEMSDHEVHVN